MPSWLPPLMLAVGAALIVAAAVGWAGIRRPVDPDVWQPQHARRGLDEDKTRWWCPLCGTYHREPCPMYETHEDTDEQTTYLYTQYTQGT